MKGGHLARKAVLVLAALAVTAGPGACSERSQLPQHKLAPPDKWDQWQPRASLLEDMRLYETQVRVWDQRICVAELLGQLSDQSGVQLAAPEQVEAMRLAVFVDRGMLSDVLSAIAEFFGGYWAFPRGEPKRLRSYALVPDASFTQPLPVWDRGYQDALARARSQQFAAERRERLMLYRRALELTPEELLERYEDSDPWLCADLLDPAVRGMVEWLLDWAEDQQERLLTQGEIAFALHDMPPWFRRHLARWAKGNWPWAERGLAVPAPDPDDVPELALPEQRWRHSSLRLVWREATLHLDLDVPDTATFSATPITSPDPYTILGARYHLVQLGYRADTAEYRDRVNREMAELQRTGSPGEHAKPPSYAPLSPEPNQTDPRLDRALRTDIWQTGRLDLASILEPFASRCGIPIVAPALPSEYGIAPRAAAEDDALTLREALEAVRHHRRELFSWGFLGDYLVATDAGYREIEASMLPPNLLEEWRERLAADEAVPVETLASWLADLNLLQVRRLRREFATHGPFSMLPLEGLRLYGLLDDSQRRRAAADKGLPFRELDPDQKLEWAHYLRECRPWSAAADLGNALIRAEPRMLATGEHGLSLTIEFNFAGAPDDRHVMYNLPLELSLAPVPPPAAAVAHP